ncbi:penicillin-binding protein [Catenisphaera adipataccumulans]|jgi:penicillin-binding protein 2B|nr:penicillin-binding protein [Catenisphaera adipataccumulans]
MNRKRSNKQLLRIIQIMVIAGTLVTANVLFTMVTKTHLWSGNSALDERIHNSIVDTTVSAKRGTIYDEDGQVIAQEVKAYTIVAYLDSSTVDADGNPDYVKNARKTAKKLKTVLKDIDVDSVTKIIQKAKKSGKAQTELGSGTKRLDKSTMKKIEKLDLDGIHFTETVSRNYPTTPYSSNLIGFASYDEDKQKIVGQMGLEKSLDKYLSGTDGEVQYQQTVDGDVLPGTTKVIKEAQDGYDVHLTLNSNVQAAVESALKETISDNKATSAWCVVMEPETGRILGWGSYPTFNQNKHTNIPSFTDNVTEMAYEPGSVMKALTYATAIDTGVYPENKTFQSGTFYYTYDPSTKKITRVNYSTEYPGISEAMGNNFGTITFDQGLAYSSNVGICELLANYVNYKKFSKYLDKFGLFQATGIPYVNEVLGTKNVDMPTSYLTTGFGQGSSITVIQLVQAYSAIFNDGKMVRPYVVESIEDPDTGKVIKKYSTKVVGQPIKSSTAEKVRSLMSHVLDDGASGEKFKMDGVDMIAKTGTGQIYNTETGEYDENTYTSSVMAAAPEDDPKVMVYWGMVSDNYLNYSAEPFQEVMKAALVAEGISGSNDTSDTSSTSDDSWDTYSMPSLVNHTKSYAKEQMSGKSVNVVYIGDGSSIIDQYPDAGTPINTNDNIFLMTNGNEITMPDMTGWTRKDVTTFAELSGISIAISGHGKVKEQSVEKGKTIDSNSQISVTLS